MLNQQFTFNYSVINRNIYLYDTDEESPNAAYYDLVLNPERFTGYSGASAVNVWKLIYDQNCFK